MSHHEEEDDMKIEGYGDDGNFFYNMEGYIGVKQKLTVERVKDVVGEIMANCSKHM